MLWRTFSWTVNPTEQDLPKPGIKTPSKSRPHLFPRQRWREQENKGREWQTPNLRRLVFLSNVIAGRSQGWVQTHRKHFASLFAFVFLTLPVAVMKHDKQATSGRKGMFSLLVQGWWDSLGGWSHWVNSQRQVKENAMLSSFSRVLFSPGIWQTMAPLRVRMDGSSHLT